MKVSGSASAARAEGSVLRAADQTGVTGGKSALAGKRRRHLIARKLTPVFTVGREEEHEFAIHGIAESQAFVWGPAAQSVQKEFLARISVLQLPGFTAVGRLVNARFFAFAARHHISVIGVERNDSAKVELVSAVHVKALPGPAFVLRLQNHAVGAGNPDYRDGLSVGAMYIGGTHATQIRIEAAGLHFPPLRLRRNAK